MLNYSAAYKYKTPDNGPVLITQCFTNSMAMLKYGPTRIWYNICRNKPYKSDTQVEYFISKNMSGDVSI